MPVFSFIIPVYREGWSINTTIDHIEHLEKKAEAEIIVIDGEAEETTIRAIVHADVKKLRSPKGRGNQLNAGAAAASGAILIFLHADTRLPPDTLPRISAAMENKTCPAGAFDLAIDSDRPVFRVIEKMASLRSRLTRIPYGDQAVFMRRGYFQEIGGFSNIPIMEDVEIMRRIRRRSDRICILPQKVRTSPRRWQQEGIFYCTARNWMLRILYSLGVKPETLVRFYR